MTASLPRFHLAFPVADLASTERFYCDVLDCAVGRRSDRWIDFDLRGHQITAHLCDERAMEGTATNRVEDHAVPVRHFGLVLEWEEWEALAGRLQERAAGFVIEPHVRFPGKPAEQATMFISDPSGNCLEFKAFRNPNAVFAA